MTTESSKQDAFNANLQSIQLGIAVYGPIEMRQYSGRVGDVGFFDREGKYRWIGNAFYDMVCSSRVAD